jgi:hypothetical protein
MSDGGLVAVQVLGTRFLLHLPGEAHPVPQLRPLSEDRNQNS